MDLKRNIIILPKLKEVYIKVTEDLDLKDIIEEKKLSKHWTNVSLGTIRMRK